LGNFAQHSPRQAVQFRASPPTPASCTVLSPSSTIGVNITVRVSLGRGSSNSHCRECFLEHVGLKGTRGQVFKMMRLAFSAAESQGPRATQGTCILHLKPQATWKDRTPGKQSYPVYPVTPTPTQTSIQFSDTQFPDSVKINYWLPGPGWEPGF